MGGGGRVKVHSYKRAPPAFIHCDVITYCSKLLLSNECPASAEAELKSFFDETTPWWTHHPMKRNTFTSFSYHSFKGLVFLRIMRCLNNINRWIYRFGFILCAVGKDCGCTTFEKERGWIITSVRNVRKRNSIYSLRFFCAICNSQLLQALRYITPRPKNTAYPKHWPSPRF